MMRPPPRPSFRCTDVPASDGARPTDAGMHIVQREPSDIVLEYEIRRYTNTIVYRIYIVHGCVSCLGWFTLYGKLIEFPDSCLSSTDITNPHILL